MVNGGGFVVTDCSTQRVVFRVDGCGIHGTKGELILRDGDGEALLLMRRKVYKFYHICVIICFICETFALLYHFEVRAFIICFCYIKGEF